MQFRSKRIFWAVFSFHFSGKRIAPNNWAKCLISVYLFFKSKSIEMLFGECQIKNLLQFFVGKFTSPVSGLKFTEPNLKKNLLEEKNKCFANSMERHFRFTRDFLLSDLFIKCFKWFFFLQYYCLSKYWCDCGNKVVYLLNDVIKWEKSDTLFRDLHQ